MQATKTTLLDHVVADRRAADQAEADLLRHVADYADEHPVTGDTLPASWTDPTILGPGAPLAGDGTPEVSAAAVEELSAALNISHHAALQIVGDALELRHRLPRLWALVQDGTLQAWKARQAARETTHLSFEAVDYTDRHLAVAATRGKWTAATVRSVVGVAVSRFEPDLAREREQAALNGRGVWFDQRHLDGQIATTFVTASLDTLDAIALDETLTDLAQQLGRLGDTSTQDVRRATALGVLADPQAALELFEGQAPPERTTSRAVVYVHLDNHTATVERAGALTRDLLDNWITRTDRVAVRPVLDLAGTRSVDRHDPPDTIREQVILRDPTCVFPGCPIRSRACDLDHIVPFDDTGPPGQTNAQNLAPLCRRHHRAKTHSAWRYERTETGGYHWTSPEARHYTVP